MTFSLEERQYLIGLLTQRLNHLEGLINAIDVMGEHAFINEGLLNEGSFQKQSYEKERLRLNQIMKIVGEKTCGK